MHQNTKKNTKEDIIKSVDLYDVYAQDNGLDSMVELVVPNSFGYAAVLCKCSKNNSKGTTMRISLVLCTRKCQWTMLQDSRGFYSRLLWLSVQSKGFHDKMWRLTLTISWQKPPVIQHLWIPQRKVHQRSRPIRGLSTGSSLTNFDKQCEHTTQRQLMRHLR